MHYLFQTSLPFILWKYAEMFLNPVIDNSQNLFVKNKDFIIIFFKRIAFLQCTEKNSTI